MKIHVKTQPKVLCAEAVGGGLRAEIEFLYGNRWDLVTTNSGHEALELLKKHGNEFQFAIIHSLLPVIGGDRLCTKIRETRNCQKLPLVLVGEADEEFPAGSIPNIEFIHRPSFRALLPKVMDRCLAAVDEPWQTFQPKQARALVVDDTKQVRVVIKRYLEQMNIDVQEAGSGFAMEESIRKNRPDFILLDVMMPTDNGLQVLQRLKAHEQNSTIPVIMVSGLDESEVIADALELGAVDYITKPICLRRFRARIKSCLDGIKLRKMEEKRRKELTLVNTELREKVELSTQDLKKSHRGMIFALSKLAESRDPETGEHLERLQEYCRVLCQSMLAAGDYTNQLHPEFIDNLVAASPLHDIGKVGIPDSVLLKPGKLSSEEFETMKRHAQIGADTLSASAEHFGNNPLLEMGIEIAQFHHEKWDGTGYPLGISGQAIPLSARILALGDVYDALTSKRVYKDAFSHEVSTSIIVEGRGSHFDPKVVDAFLRVENRFREIRRTHDDTEKKEAVTL